MEEHNEIDVELEKLLLFTVNKVSNHSIRSLNILDVIFVISYKYQLDILAKTF